MSEESVITFSFYLMQSAELCGAGDSLMYCQSFYSAALRHIRGLLSVVLVHTADEKLPRCVVHLFNKNAHFVTRRNECLMWCFSPTIVSCKRSVETIWTAWTLIVVQTRQLQNDGLTVFFKDSTVTHEGQTILLKVQYATFYGPMNKQRDRALDTRNSSLEELTWILDVL